MISSPEANDLSLTKIAGSIRLGIWLLVRLTLRMRPNSISTEIKSSNNRRTTSTNPCSSQWLNEDFGLTIMETK